MSQYGVGQVKVLSADPNRWILLSGSTTGNIAPGNIVKFDGESNLWFTVATIIDALTFETVENYTGTKPFDVFAPYLVTRDFTPNLLLPEAVQGDRNTADIYTRAMRRLDGLAGTQLVKLTNATGAGLVAGDVVTYATGSDRAVALMTVAGSFQKLLITLDASIANGAQGLFLTEGVALAKVTGTIVRGNYIQASATSKTVADTGTAVTAAGAPPVGAAGIALTAAVSGFATVALFSSTVGSTGGGGSGIPATIVDAKGDLIVATAADTVARLAVGPNGQLLSADSATATGLKWIAAAGGGAGTVTSVQLAPPLQEFSAIGGPITAAGTITLARLSVNALGDITGAITYDWNTGCAFSARLTGNVTLTLTNPLNTGVPYRILIRQDGTGSRTLTFPASVVWPGAGTAVTINSPANQRTQIELLWDGTNYHGSMTKVGSS